MTVKPTLDAVAEAVGAIRVRGYVNQIIMVILINVPTLSFGLAMGWVSLASGEGGEGDESDDKEVVIGAAITFLASLVGMPLWAFALAAGRKIAAVATSAAFVACWSLKLCGGGWWVGSARVCAGFGGAGAWCLAPLLAREMCAARVRGAASASLMLAHHLGFLLMYLAADAQLPHRTVLWCCLSLAVAHCVLFLFMPESPPYLAANGKPEEARTALAWLRGVSRDDPVLKAELDALPPPDQHLVSQFKLAKDMLSDVRRRRAFILCLVVVAGQEAFGLLALMQFAERVFIIARDDEVVAAHAGDAAGALGSPARYAVMLGATQLVASILSLYLVEKAGRKRLIVWSAALSGACLALSAGAAWRGAGGAWVGGALAAAVCVDSAGLQSAPYAMLADMFHYQYRGCAVTLVIGAAWAANAVEMLVFPVMATAVGLGPALVLAATLTLALAVFAAFCLTETRGKTPDEIYDAICPLTKQPESVVVPNVECCSKETACTNM